MTSQIEILHTTTMQIVFPASIDPQEDLDALERTLRGIENVTTRIRFTETGGQEIVIDFLMADFHRVAEFLTEAQWF